MSLTKALIQLVQVPLHGLLFVFVVLIWYRSRHRRAWSWLLAALVAMAGRRFATLYWLGGPDSETWLLLDQAFFPTVTALCLNTWAFLLWKSTEDWKNTRNRHVR